MNLVAEIGETIDRCTVLAELNLTPRLRREDRIRFPRKGKVRLDFSGTEKPIRLSVEARSYEIVIMPFRPPEDFQVQTHGQKS